MSRRSAPGTPSSPRPRVLLVDDHRQFLDAVSGMLAEDFEVIGAATDGRRALDMAIELEPQIIVLDIEMPGLDGFQTLRAIHQAGLAATPAVFVSMHDSDEYVSEAFRCGAQGYVVKPRISRDLATALDHALLGRAFVPSLTSLFQLASGGMHALQLRNDPETFLDDVASFFDFALRRGDATCVIATAQVRQGLHERLRTFGHDVGGSSGPKRYVAMDAADALKRFMRDGLPAADRLAEIVAELDQYRRDAGQGAEPRLTIFGTMADMLGAEGNANAMLPLESLWDTLTHDLPFVTVCGYATSRFHDGEPHLWPGVCNAHRALSHAPDV